MSCGESKRRLRREEKVIKTDGSSNVLVTFIVRLSSQAVASKFWYLVERVREKDSCSPLDMSVVTRATSTYVSTQKALSQNQEDSICP